MQRLTAGPARTWLQSWLTSVVQASRRRSAAISWFEGRSAAEADTWTAVALGVLMCVAGWHASQFAAVHIDDAFITFRYADNLARGGGFVFNRGERVEGTSTFLTTLLLAAGALAHVPPLVGMRVLAVVSYAAVIACTFALVREIAGPGARLAGLGAAAMVAASTPLAFYAVSGMETLFYAAVLAAALLLYTRASARDTSPKGWSLVLGALALIRPEGAGVFAVVWLVDTWRGARHGDASSTIGRAARAAGWFALVYAPVLVFRLLYFHALVPNSVIAKAGFFAELREAHTLGERLALVFLGPGMQLCRTFFDNFRPWCWVLAVIPLVGRGQTRERVLAAVVGFGVAVDVADYGDWMPFQRLLLPVLPIIAIGIALGLRAVVVCVGRRAPRWQLVAGVVAAAVMVDSAGKLATTGEWRISPSESYREAMGRALAAVRRDDDVLATDMAGLIPYLSGMRTIDMNGLCDAHIAGYGAPLGPMGRLDRGYAIAQHPTFYQPNFTTEAKAIFDDPAFARDRGAYFAIDTAFIRAANWRDQRLLLVRKDRPHVEDVARALHGSLVDFASMLRRLGL